ncbi:hypothetical protein [Streptomyces sp. MBT27]|uniref:hypothetical protein n=1 Tax=Streptomyces sp. MBT27 TaxID=1488356 RepID=UPI0014209811|nr:hypothetical protein [Streptomyces sp. MBT27]
MPAPEPGPTREDVDDEIEYLGLLSDDDYAQEFAELIQDLPLSNRVVPRTVTGLALRSDELSRRSAKIVELLHEQADRFLIPVEGESRTAHTRRLTAFRARMDTERVLLQIVMAAYQARRGRMPTRANPRRRAADELARRHPEEFLALVREEQEKDKARRKSKPRAQVSEAKQ